MVPLIWFRYILCGICKYLLNCTLKVGTLHAKNGKKKENCYPTGTLDFHKKYLNSQDAQLLIHQNIYPKIPNS